MVSSRAWFTLAVAGVLGLFYVGYGLQGSSPSGVTQAQEIKVKPLFEQPDQPRAKAGPPAVNLDWEHLGSKIGGVEATGGGSPRSYRAKITGGWLVEVSRSVRGPGGQGYGAGVGLAFVPDPEHKWDGSSTP